MKPLVPLLLACGFLRAAEKTDWPANGSFENDLAGWTVVAGEEGAKITPEAALLGARGLRVEVPAGTKFTLESAPFPVEPGKTYTVSLWTAAQDGMPAGPAPVNAQMIFRGEDGKELAPAPARIRKWPAASLKGETFPANTLLGAAAPEGAATLTLRFGTTGRDAAGPLVIDDVQIAALSDEPPPTPAPGQGHPIPPSDPERLRALEEEIAGNPTRGKSPPKIVIKLDDFGPSGTGVHARWRKVADFAREKGIKVTFGIIGQRMAADCPDFVAWTREQHAAGRIEFWHHGWDHAERSENGKRVMEFSGESYDHQKQHLAETQKLAREKLGFAFVSFGAPFNATDDSTVRVLAEDPDIKVWMYGPPDKPAGKTVLERSFAVNIENPTLIPNYGAFLEGYAHSRGARYFVLQGHPAGWGDDRWEQFVKIVEFLIAQKAEFVFASDLAGKTSEK